MNARSFGRIGREVGEIGLAREPSVMIGRTSIMTRQFRHYGLRWKAAYRSVFSLIKKWRRSALRYLDVARYRDDRNPLLDASVMVLLTARTFSRCESYTLNGCNCYGRFGDFRAGCLVKLEFPNRLLTVNDELSGVLGPRPWCQRGDVFASGDDYRALVTSRHEHSNERKPVIDDIRISGARSVM